MGSKITITKKNYTSNCAPSGVYVGRPSPLGNPYLIGTHGNRLQVIEKYRAWLAEKLRNPASHAAREMFRLCNIVERGEDLELVCWCAPLPCHAEVIKETIEEIVRKRMERRNKMRKKERKI